MLWTVTLEGEPFLNSELSREDTDTLERFVAAFFGSVVPDMPFGSVPWNRRDQRALFLAAVAYAGELAAEPIDVTAVWNGEADPTELRPGVVQ